MPAEDHPPDLNSYHHSPDELHALELRWYEGRMLPFADWLFAFVESQRHEILLRAGEQRDSAALLAATRQLIAESGSLHLASELKDQMREIQNELWYRGQKGEHDRARIQREWTLNHAAAWRRWRIKEYLFVVDRCAIRIGATLREERPPTDTA